MRVVRFIKKAQFTKRTLSRRCKWPALVVIVFVCLLLIVNKRLVAY